MFFYKCSICGLLTNEMFKKCPSCGVEAANTKELYVKVEICGELPKPR